MPPATTPVPKKTFNKSINIGAVVYVVLFLLVCGAAFLYLIHGGSCGSASETKQMLKLPASFKEIKEEKRECNSFGGYTNKLLVTYDTSSATPSDFEALEDSITAIGYTPSDDPNDFAFYRRVGVSETHSHYSHITVEFDGRATPKTSTANFNDSENNIQRVTIYFNSQQ